MDVTIAIATFGDDSWRTLAEERAWSSAQAVRFATEHDVTIIGYHGSSLDQARNHLLAVAQTEWIVFLDADDELTPGYIDAMATSSADLRAPSVSYVRKYRAPRRPGMPRVAGHTHDCTADCLPEGNWLVVGTAARTDLLRQVGGWHDWPLYEDWDLWLRCWRQGATIEAVPAAVYRAHVRFDSRNRAPAMRYKDRVHRAIYRANFPQEAAA